MLRQRARQRRHGLYFDVTKLAVNTLDVGLAGIEVYDVLRDFYDIQTEFATWATCSPMSRLRP